MKPRRIFASDFAGKKVHLGLMADPPWRDHVGELTGEIETEPTGDEWYWVYVSYVGRTQRFTAQMLYPIHDDLHHVRCAWCKREPGFRLTTVAHSHGICAPCRRQYFPRKGGTK